VSALRVVLARHKNSKQSQGPRQHQLGIGTNHREAALMAKRIECSPNQSHSTDMSRAAKLRCGIGFCELRILLWSIGGNSFYFLVSRLQEGNKGGNIPMCTSIYI